MGARALRRQEGQEPGGPKPLPVGGGGLARNRLQFAPHQLHTAHLLMIKRAGLRTILFGLSHVLRACARVDAKFRREMRRHDIVAQMRLKDGSIGRWYAIEGGRVRSRAGLHAKPDVTIAFRDLATAFTFLVPPPDQSEIVHAAKHFRVTVYGKSELVVWFMQLLNSIPRTGMRYGTRMPDGTTRYTTCTNGGPLYAFVKDSRIVRITPIDFDQRDAPSWTIRARGRRSRPGAAPRSIRTRWR